MPEGFHQAFLDAVAGDASALAPWCAPENSAAGLSVYRNTLAKGCADALIAQFPTVQQVVGLDWLTSAAIAHAREHPPHEASLLAYGAAFPGWLRTFSPADDLPFLAGLAQLDRLWTEAHLAADSPPLDATAIARMTPPAFAIHALALHPATRFAGFADSTPSLWRALQPPAPAALELESAPQGILFIRPELDVVHQLLTAGELAFLTACRSDLSLAEAALRALDAEPQLDLASAFARLIAAGAFTQLRTLAP